MSFPILSTSRLPFPSSLSSSSISPSLSLSLSSILQNVKGHHHPNRNAHPSFPSLRRSFSSSSSSSASPPSSSPPLFSNLFYTIPSPSSSSSSSSPPPLPTPIYFLPGLLGQSLNFRGIAISLGKKLESRGIGGKGGIQLIGVDCLNHGKSPHDDRGVDMEKDGITHYQVQCDYFHSTFLSPRGHFSPSLPAGIIGHSMGGRVTLLLSLFYPSLFSFTIAIDMAPIDYSPGNPQWQSILSILYSMKLADEQIFPYYSSNDKKEISSFLKKHSELLNGDLQTLTFVMQNLVDNGSDNGNQRYQWRCNIHSLYNWVLSGQTAKFSPSLSSSSPPSPSPLPTLFIRGTKSSYIDINNKDQMREMNTLFPHHMVKEVNAGHWVHAERPKETVEIMEEFIVNHTELGKGKEWGT